MDTLSKYIYQYHQEVLTARISLVFTSYSSLLTIFLSDPSRQRPVFALSDECNFLLDGQQRCVCEGVYWTISLRSLSSWQCPVYLVRFTWMVCELRFKWSYSFCFLGWRFRGLFKTVISIFMTFSPQIFFRYCVKIHLVQPYNITQTATTWKNSRFISLDIIFPYDRQPVNSSRRFPYTYVDIIISRWDTAGDEYELVY